MMMAEDAMPAPAQTENFPDVAKLAGEKFKDAIANGLIPTTKTLAFLSYKIEPIKDDSPAYVLDLHRVMKQFEGQVSDV
jgi:hypothetical protein